MKKPYRNFLWVYLSTTLSALVSVALINYHFDPGELFHHRVEDTISSILLKGKNAAGVKNLDEGILARKVITDRRSTPDTIIMGSSRSMTLQSDHLPDIELFYNNAISSAVLHDLYAITHLYQKREVLPKTVIFGIDPWIFNPKSNHRWSSLQKECDDMVKQLKLTSPPLVNTAHQPNRWKELISLQYLRASLKSYNLPDPKESIFELSDEIVKRDILNPAGMLGHATVRRSDGAVIFPLRERQKTGEDTSRDSAIYNPTFLRYPKLSDHNKKCFEMLVDFWQKSGSKVVFLLPPYHPDFYARVKDDGPATMLEEAEVYVRSLGTQLNVPVVGGYNPKPFGFTASDFTDQRHPRPKVMASLFSSVSL
jgi:hypothetical protein